MRGNAGKVRLRRRCCRESPCEPRDAGGGYAARLPLRHRSDSVIVRFVHEMHRTRLLCAIGVTLWSVVVVGSQATTAGALSTELRTHVRDGRFGIVTSIRGLPLGVREALQTLFGSRTLDIAEPGAEFQRTDVIVTPNLPIRRLVAAGCSTTNHCLVYYERGGFAHTWHVALFHWTPAATRFEWGGSAPGGLKTIDDVRNALLSGTIKSDQARF